MSGTSWMEICSWTGTSWRQTFSHLCCIGLSISTSPNNKQQMMKDVEFMVQMSVSLLLAHTTWLQCPRHTTNIFFFSKQSILHCGMGAMVDNGFNCFIFFYLSSVEKCCFLFGDLFAKWYSTDSDSLKHFAAYACSACSLAVASTANSSFAK